MSQSSAHHGSAPLPSSSCPRADIRLELCLPFSNLSTPWQRLHLQAIPESGHPLGAHIAATVSDSFLLL